MKIGLFVPCFVEQLYPDVGLATVDVLEGQGLAVEYPEAQTCCGQPFANTGCDPDARPLAERFLQIFAPYDYVVCPSGSCVSMVRHQYGRFFGADSTYARLASRTFELCEFLTDVLKVDRLSGRFPHKVGIHQSCHGLRELRLAPGSERVATGVDKARSLLATLDGIELTSPNRPDECCGFGGTFAVGEPEVSCAMGLDRIAAHQEAGTEVLTAGDMSCLMHLEGLIRRGGKLLPIMHLAQIFAGRPVPGPSLQASAEAPHQARVTR